MTTPSVAYGTIFNTLSTSVLVDTQSGTHVEGMAYASALLSDPSVAFRLSRGDFARQNDSVPSTVSGLPVALANALARTQALNNGATPPAPVAPVASLPGIIGTLADGQVPVYSAVNKAFLPGAGGSVSVSGASSLSPTSIKTANYTLAAGDLALFDTTAGTLTATFPTAPADKTQVAVLLDRSATPVNLLSYAAGSGDFLDATLSGKIGLVGEEVLFQYVAGTKTWEPATSRLPLAQLDGRYAPSLADGGVAAVATMGTNKGKISGLATLDGAAQVPLTQLGNVGTLELAYAENATGTTTVFSTTAGTGTDVPSTQITVPVSTRPVWLEWGGAVDITTAPMTGGADLYLAVVDVATGSIVAAAPVLTYPGAATAGGENVVHARKRLGATGASKQYKLQVTYYGTTGGAYAIDNGNIMIAGVKLYPTYLTATSR